MRMLRLLRVSAYLSKCHFGRSFLISVYLRYGCDEEDLEVGTQWVFSPEPAFSSYRSTIP